MAALITNTLIHELLNLPSRQLWTDYDAEADDTIMEEDGNLYHYAGDTLVGVTILNVSHKGMALT